MSKPAYIYRYSVRATRTETPQFWNELQGGEMKVFGKTYFRGVWTPRLASHQKITGKPQAAFL